MSIFTDRTGLQILEFISTLKTNYGMNNLSNMVQHKFSGFSIRHAKELLSQLIEKEYLKKTDIGSRFAIVVVALSDKGREAIINHETIILDFQRFCTPTFKSASDLGVVDKDIIEEYYNLKKELILLQKREEELKDVIKQAMIKANTSEIHSDLMDLYCKRIERVTYPKEKIERFVPNNILDKIRTVNESIILITRLKTKGNDTL